ncbi:MAG: hypothetical protein QG604_286 [Candidatus Dependentiae bacterium]|nr:hypothetical protein [Candidatus Dependentiae bacterium]
MKKNALLLTLGLGLILPFINPTLQASTEAPDEDYENIPAEILAWFKPDAEITLPATGHWDAEESMSIAEAWSTQENEDSDDEDVALAAKIQKHAQSLVNRMNRISEEMVPWISLDESVTGTTVMADGSHHEASYTLKDIIFATVAESNSLSRVEAQKALTYFQSKAAEKKKVPLWIWEAQIPLTQHISYFPLALRPVIIPVGPSFSRRSPFPSNPIRPLAKATIQEIYDNPYNREYDSCREQLEEIHQKSVALAHKNSLLEADLDELDFAQNSIEYSASWLARHQEGDATTFALETREFTVQRGLSLASVYAHLAVVDEADLDTLALHPHFPTDEQDKATAADLKNKLDAQEKPLSFKEKAALFFYGQDKEENPTKTWSLFKKIGVAADETRRPTHLPDYATFEKGMNTLLDNSTGTVSPRARRYLTSPKMLVWYYANGDQAIDKELFTILNAVSEETAVEACQNPDLLEWFGNQKLSCEVITDSHTEYNGSERITITNSIIYEPATILQILDGPPSAKNERIELLKNRMAEQKRRPMIASVLSAATLFVVGASLFTRNVLCRNEDNKTIYLVTSYITEELDKNGGETNDLFLENLQRELRTRFHFTAEEIQVLMPSWKIIAENTQQLLLAMTISYTNKELDTVSMSTSGLPEKMRKAVKVIQQRLGLRWSIPEKIARIFRK